ncbi:hypothetical protein DPMN_099978 [Dreissena polymorpha]|uniref:Uncharacterized protein n=1 Tax=Dreissena polymorpha TaxID=45954 RepID=A0A9D4R6X9_DREPO|nr:hypothetical protein DPMN_099978 [Dreissena polymorpha]
MALSAAEKQRRYRQRRDEDKERRQAYLQKEKQKYIADKAVGKKKLIGDLSERGKRLQRKQSRKRQNLSRKQSIEMNAECLQTPASSTENHNVASTSTDTGSTCRKSLSKLKYKQTVELRYMQRQLDTAQKKAEMYRKRWERERSKKVSGSQQITPRSRTKKLLQNFSRSSKEVKKNLMFHNCLIDQIKRKYRQKTAHKKTVSEICCGSILRKYKLKTIAMKQFGPQQKQDRKRKGSLIHRLRKSIQDFYERDDVSRIVSGYKNTVTQQKYKQQKRLLLDSLENLHVRYMSETNIKISYTSFTRVRSFWVKQPKDSDRDTCLCKKCENVKMMAEVLKGRNRHP